MSDTTANAVRAVHRLVAIHLTTATDADAMRAVAVFIRGVAQGLHIGGVIDAGQESALTFHAEAQAAIAIHYLQAVSPSAPGSTGVSPAPAPDAEGTSIGANLYAAMPMIELRALRQARNALDISMSGAQCRAAIDRLIADRSREHAAAIAARLDADASAPA